ncbi:MAG TPA: hypothetical protein VFN72_09065 [Solirubrobacterales bacterium]|nr:hypothetical protein [Solirubrobacterales bacterium]
MYDHDGTTPGQADSSDAPKVARRWVGDPTSPAPTAKDRPDPKPEYESYRSWDKLLLVVGAIVVVVALLVVPGLLNRGGQNPVAAAAEATSNVSGAHFTFTGNATGTESVSMSGRGVMNGETNRLSLIMSATGSTAAGTQGFTLQEVVDEGDLYLNSPELGAAFGGSDRWMLVRSEALGNLLQADASGGGMSASPSQQLDALKDASYEVAEVGPEQVNGLNTTRYRALLDIGKLTDELKDEVSGEYGEVIERSMDQVSSASVDVWIDSDGLIRREASNTSMGSLGTFSMTMDFSHYGSHPDIQVPPSSQVFDVTSLMQNALDELNS